MCAKLHVVFSQAVPVGDIALGTLSSEQLRQLACRDYNALSPWQQKKVVTVRQYCHLLPGGAFVNSFHITGVEVPVLSNIRLQAVCDCDAEVVLCGTPEHFLDNFRRHLRSEKHQRAAAKRFSVWCASFRDKASAAAAAASTAAAAGMHVAASDLEAIQRFSASAAAAADRAATAATTAESLPPIAGSVLPDEPVMSELEQLVHFNPALSWMSTEEGMRGQPFCDWCRVPFTITSDANSLRVINEHLNSKRHRERLSYGGRTIASFFQLHTGPSPPPPQPAAPPDRSTLCAGYHHKTLRIGTREIDISPLLQAEVSDASDYFPEPYFRRTLKLATGNGGSQSLEVKGTFRSRLCSGFCVDAFGHVLPHGICTECRRVPKIAAFQKRALRWAGGESSRNSTKFEHMSSERRLDVMRALRERVRQLNSTVFLLQQVAPSPHHSQRSRSRCIIPTCVSPACTMRHPHTTSVHTPPHTLSTTTTTTYEPPRAHGGCA